MCLRSGRQLNPDEGGASIAIASIFALAVPVAVGWACTRGDRVLESVSSRPILMLDLALACLVVALTGAAAIGLHYADVAPTGLVAARAAAVYLGLMLVSQPWGGWRVAAIAPAVYLLAVIVMGRGEDIHHPAVWAWIAADASDGLSWLFTVAVLCAGLVAYVLMPRRTFERATDE